MMHISSALIATILALILVTSSLAAPVLVDGCQATYDEPSFQDYSLKTTIRAAGSSFSQSYGGVLADGFKYAKSDIDITYDPVGSKCGRVLLGSDLVEVAFSETPIPVEESLANLSIKQYPFVISPNVIIHNVRSMADNSTLDLILSRAVLAGIFNNTITTWDDSMIKADNPLIASALPNTTITIIFPEQSPGATYTHTAALAKFGWGLSATAVDSFDSQLVANLTWNAVNHTSRWIRVSSSSDVAVTVQNTLDSISYLPWASIVTLRDFTFKFARLKNKVDLFYSFPNFTTILRSLDEVQLAADNSIDAADLENRWAWPFVGIHYLVLNTSASFSPERCARRHEMGKWLSWTLSDNWALSRITSNGFSPLSLTKRTEVINKLGQVACATGNWTSITSTSLRPQRVHEGHAPIFAVSMTIFAISFVFMLIYIFKSWGHEQRLVLVFAVLPSVGAFVSYTAVIFWFLVPTSTAICELRKWLTCIGMTLMLGALFSKTLQINAIYGFATRRIQNLQRGVKHVLIVSSSLIIVLSIQILLLIIWTATDPWVASRVITNPIELVDEWACVSTNNNGSMSTWLIIQIVWIAILCIFPSFVVYRTWEMKQSVTDSKWILLYTTFVMITLAMIIPWISIIQPNDDALYFFASCTITFLTFVTIVAFHISKSIRTDKDTSHTGPGSSKWTGTMSQHSSTFNTSS